MTKKILLSQEREPDDQGARAAARGMTGDFRGCCWVLGRVDRRDPCSGATWAAGF